MTASSAASLGRAATHAAAEVLDQDEHSADWRTQRKHFFVLSNAGASLLTAEKKCLWCIFYIQSAVWSGESMQCCRQHTNPARGPAITWGLASSISPDINAVKRPHHLCRHRSSCISAVVLVFHVHAVLDVPYTPRRACMPAGRPVFTAHGSEHALAGFMAIIDAMMSFVKDRGDALRSMR